MTGELIRYDAMCRAIEQAHEIDEVKDIRDKAVALEAYARQAVNFENEIYASKIRIRAERRCGQLLREMQKAKGSAQPGVGRKGAGGMPSDGTRTLAELGISHDQSSQWQKLATIDDKTFEAAFEEPVARPSTAHVLQFAGLGPPPPSQDEIDTYKRATEPTTLWVAATIRDFEEHLDREPEEIAGNMSEHQLEGVRRLAPRVVAWLQQLEAACRRNSRSS